MVKVSSYSDILKEAEKAIGERGKVVPNSKGEFRVPRKYHLTKLEILELKKNSKGFPNPFKKCGIYHNLIQALINLGVNKRHSFGNIKNEIKNVMISKGGISLWDKFVNKEPRSRMSGKDVNGRIIQNALVMQRLSGFHPYGLRIFVLGACINIYKDSNGLPEMELNTNFKEGDVPINELKNGKRGRRRKTN
jgi:hypothetical protein